MPVPLASFGSPVGNVGPTGRRLLAAALLLLAAVFLVSSAAALTPTTTILSASSTTVTAGNTVTLTAYVHASGGGPYGGQVAFCDTAVALCTDIHQLGTSALLAGYAYLNVVPGAGTHVYTAIYRGNTSFNTSYTASTSNTVTVLATPLRPTSTSIVQSGGSGGYSLFTAVSGAGIAPPTGAVSFLDTSNANYVLGTAVLGSGSSTLALSNGTSCFLGSGSGASGIVTGDFNRDGIPILPSQTPPPTSYKSAWPTSTERSRRLPGACPPRLPA